MKKERQEKLHYLPGVTKWLAEQGLEPRLDGEPLFLNSGYTPALNCCCIKCKEVGISREILEKKPKEMFWHDQLRRNSKQRQREMD